MNPRRRRHQRLMRAERRNPIGRKFTARQRRGPDEVIALARRMGAAAAMFIVRLVKGYGAWTGPR
jgi:hypothetical protein